MSPYQTRGGSSCSTYLLDPLFVWKDRLLQEPLQPYRERRRKARHIVQGLEDDPPIHTGLSWDVVVVVLS